jgi:hypothetical protein
MVIPTYGGRMVPPVRGTLICFQTINMLSCRKSKAYANAYSNVNFMKRKMHVSCKITHFTPKRQTYQ